jgi:hypothetical protein
MSFLKTGKDARREAAVVDEAKRQRDEESKVFRFFVKRGTERRITFLDGDLDQDGELSMTMYYEHNLYMNGNWRNFFVCTGNEDEPCPICEEGKMPAMVAVFTVIDHTEYVDRNGNTHKDQVMLLVAKRQTQKLLEYQAAKRGGIAGVTFDVARMDEDQSPAVGTSFDFVEKNDVSKVLKHFGAEVINYESVINYRTPDELRKMGFGKQSGKIGNEPGVTDDAPWTDADEDETPEPDKSVKANSVLFDGDDDVGLNIDDMDDDL